MFQGDDWTAQVHSRPDGTCLRAVAMSPPAPCGGRGMASLRLDWTLEDGLSSYFLVDWMERDKVGPIGAVRSERMFDGSGEWEPIALDLEVAGGDRIGIRGPENMETRIRDCDAVALKFDHGGDEINVRCTTMGSRKALAAVMARHWAAVAAE